MLRCLKGSDKETSMMNYYGYLCIMFHFFFCRLTLAMKADCTNQTILPMCTFSDDQLCVPELCSEPGIGALCPLTCGLCRNSRSKREIADDQQQINSESVNDISPKTVSTFIYVLR